MPPTDHPTWLAAFSTICIAVVSFVCVESCLVAYLATKRGEIPIYAQYFVRFSKFYLRFLHTKKEKQSNKASVILAKRASSANVTATATASSMNMNSDNNEEISVQMTDVNRDDAENPILMNSNNNKVNVVANDTRSTGQNNESKTKTSTRSASLIPFVNSNTDNNIDDDDDESAPFIHDTLGDHDTAKWEQFARAIDRMCRVVTPIIYITLVFLKFNEVSDRTKI